MVGNRFRRRTAVWVALGVVIVVLLVGGLPSNIGRTAVPLTDAASSLSVSISITPSTPTAGNQFTVTADVSGGVSPYTYSWSDVPQGCFSSPSQNWTCTLSGSGGYSVSVTVTDSDSNQGAATQSFTVTGSGGNGNGGNGNGNGNGGSSNGNSSNGLNLSSFGPILVYGLIAGIIVFALLVALTVGVIMIAVTLSRRLPRVPRHGVVCGSCHATAPPGSKFCPACSAPLPPST